MQSVPLPVVSRLLGHSQARMTLRYAHVGDREIEAAAERIGCAIAALLDEPATVPPEPKTAGKLNRPSGSHGGTAVPAAEAAVNVLTLNCASGTLLRDMETVNALELRQSLGKVLDQLERGGEPILVCRRRTPAAALVSLKDYRERFVDREADDQRREVVARLKQLKFRSPAAGTTLDVLRDLRS